MQLSDEEGFDRLPKLTLSAFIAIVLALVALHLLIQYILSRQFLITAARPLAQKLDSLEYNYVYHLSLVILLLSDVNWNLFDLAIWIGSYVGVGFIRISVQTIKNEQEMLLNDYAYNRNLVKLLCSSQIYGIILFFISITYFFIAFFAFVEAPQPLPSLLLFPTIMLGIDSLFLFLYSNKAQENIMYYVNQNTDIVQPTHRLELWERVIGAGVRFWYYATLVRLFAGSFRNKFSFTCYLWMCSIYNALSNAGLNLYRSVKVGGEFSRYLTKINRIFKLTKTSPEEVCIICMSELLNCRKLVQCGHLFHTKCLFLWLQNKSECPTCRTVIRLD